jgi:HEAT repeat protein
MLIEGEFDSPSAEVSISAIIAAGMIRGRVDTSRASSMLHRLANSLPSSTKDDEFARYRVAATYTALGMLGGDWPLNLLLNKVTASDQLTAISAAISLSLLGGIPYREPLIEAMQNANNPADVRTAAVFSLGMTRAPGVLEELIQTATQGSNVDIRAHAIFALALNGDSTAIPALHSIITDARLARSADGNYLRGCAALSMVKLNAGTAHLLALKRAMEQSDDENFVAFSALSLGLTGDESYLESLIPLLESSSRNVRMAAAIGLGFSGHEAYLPELQRVVSASRHAETRVHAAVGCGLLGDPSAVGTLTALLDPASEGNSGVRLASAIGLMLLRSNDPQVVKRLATTANDPDMRVRRYAAIARFVLGDDAGLDSFADSLRTGGMECKKLDSQLLQFWANSSLPPFFKLRSYLFN